MITIFDHAMTLKNHFKKYFPEGIIRYDWIKDPFTEKKHYRISQLYTEKEQLIEILSVIPH